MSLHFSRSLSHWLEVLAIAAWGVLFLKYWSDGKLYVLIHPNYFWLTVVAGFVLLMVASWRAIILLRQRRSTTEPQHITLFPPSVSSLLLIAIAILGLMIPPRAFASQTALDRGVTDTLNLTRVKPQAFRSGSNSEDKSIIDWLRTVTVYPEPDAYAGQKVKVKGFVIHSPKLPQNYLLISRFILTCCAADAYPVSLPVKLPTNQNRDAYKPDSWLEISGQMVTETLEERRQVTIAAQSLQPISEPKNPYDY
jgi:uncharacterized repeat protein (TIGR03943 family)